MSNIPKKVGDLKYEVYRCISNGVPELCHKTNVLNNAKTYARTKIIADLKEQTVSTIKVINKRKNITEYVEHVVSVGTDHLISIGF